MKRFYIVFFALFVVVRLSAQVFTDSNLPIVIINTDIDPETGEPTEIVDEPKVLASMKIIYHTDDSRNYVSDQNNSEFLDYDGRIGIEFRGSSSQLLPKKPYSVETRKNDDISNNNVKILGMPKENDWILNSLAYDKSLVRDYLSYDLARNIGDYAARGKYCEVVINDDYKGLYIIMEKIKVDSDRINIADIEVDDNELPEVTGGYYTKCDKVNEGETIAWSYPTTTPDPANFLHEQPSQEDVTVQQNNYIKSVFDELLSTTVAQNASITNGFPSVIDIPSFVDFMLLNELASNVDAYQYSTYFHKDRGGKLRAGPIWDFNLTYGNDIYGNRSGTDVWQFDNGDNVGPAFWKSLFENPEFNCYLSNRWQNLTALGQALNYAALISEIDFLKTFLAEAKVREQQRWHTLNGYNQEILNLKSWLQDRYDFLNDNLVVTGACSFPDTPALVISKIHYHPDDVGAIDGDDLEFIGITNNSNDPIDLTGVYFSALGISYQFSEGATIDAGEIIYLAINSQVFEDFYGIAAFGQYFRDLSNSSQLLELADAFGNVIDSVPYTDSNPWPEEADGDGAYLVLNDLDSDNSLAINWSTSESFGLCTGTTQWKGATLGWNHGSPNSSKEAVISADYQVDVNGNIDACSLVVNNGSTLTIDAGEYVKIENDIRVSGNLSILQESSLVQINDNTSVTNNGTINVNYTTPYMLPKTFVIVGSPMTTEDRNGVFAAGFDFFEHLTENFVPNPDVAAQFPDAENFADDNRDNWVRYSGMVNPGEGYLLRPQLNSTDGDKTYDFIFEQGTLNTGNIDFTVKYNTDKNSSPNVLANPYPSAISAVDFIMENPMVDEVYFWNPLTPPSPDLPGAYTMNFTMEDISMYNLMGGIAAASDPTHTETIPSGYISTAEGFGIKATAAGVARFTNAMRVTDENNIPARAALNADRVWIQIENSQYQMQKSTLLGFSEFTTPDLDPGYDSRRLATVVSLYTHLGDSNKGLGIQSLDAFQDGAKVFVGFSTLLDEDLDYTISLGNIEGPNLPNATIYLIDNELNILTNLNEGNYTFKAGKGTYDRRFTLQFKAEDILGSPDEGLSTIMVVPNPAKDLLHIISPKVPITRALIYDVQGRMVMKRTFSEGNYQMDLSKLKAAIYFLKLETTDGIVRKQIIKE